MKDLLPSWEVIFYGATQGVTSAILNTDNTIYIRLESGPMYFLFGKIKYYSHGYVSERALDRIERLLILSLWITSL